jgi:hypothetical protein
MTDTDRAKAWVARQLRFEHVLRTLEQTVHGEDGTERRAGARRTPGTGV